jgi:hypothetical protein
MKYVLEWGRIMFTTHFNHPFLKNESSPMFHIVHTTTSYQCVEKWATLTPVLTYSSTDTIPTTKRAATGAPSEPPVSNKKHRTMLQVFASLNGDNGYKHRAVLAPIEYSDSE